MRGPECLRERLSPARPPRQANAYTAFCQPCRSPTSSRDMVATDSGCNGFLVSQTNESGTNAYRSTDERRGTTFLLNLLARSRRLPAKHETPIAVAPAGSRCKPITSYIGQQHVGAMSSRSFPHADRTTFLCCNPTPHFPLVRWPHRAPSRSRHDPLIDEQPCFSRDSDAIAWSAPLRCRAGRP